LATPSKQLATGFRCYPEQSKATGNEDFGSVLTSSATLTPPKQTNKQTMQTNIQAIKASPSHEELLLVLYEDIMENPKLLERAVYDHIGIDCGDPVGGCEVVGSSKSKQHKGR
jgi:hypothetical protein